MWRSVRDPSTVDKYLAENQADPGSSQLVELLHWLRSNAGERELFAVTSNGRLRLTTSSNYMEGDDHPSIAVSRSGREFSVSYHRAHETVPLTTTVVEEHEVIDAVQRLLLQMLREAS